MRVSRKGKLAVTYYLAVNSIYSHSNKILNGDLMESLIY